MAHRVTWSGRALADLEAIAEFIAQDSPSYAKTVVGKVVAQTRNLSAFPRSGRIVPEFGDEHIREVFAYSYRIIYRLEDPEIIVVTVLHGKRILHP